jgi:hypothetical protein
VFVVRIVSQTAIISIFVLVLIGPNAERQYESQQQ